MQQKGWFKSKTLWVNAIAFLAILIQSQTGFVIDLEAQGAILAVINVVLRMVTKEPLNWKKDKATNNMISYILIPLLFLSPLIVQGCAGNQAAQIDVNLDNEATQDALVEISARNLAYYVSRNNPEIIEPGIAFCGAFEGEGADLHALLHTGLKYLDARVEDNPTLAYDLETLLKLFNIQVIDKEVALTDRQKAMIRLAARAFKQGLELAKVNPKT